MIVELPLATVAGPVLSYGYGTLLDPDSESRNFETIGKTAYLYYTRFNQGHSTLDRDLIRVPIEFFPNETGNAGNLIRREILKDGLSGINFSP